MISYNRFLVRGMLLLLAVGWLLSACGQHGAKYVIGVSQCSDDIWREKQNEELRMATFFYDNVTLEFASADDDDKVQIAQINHFIDEGVDLLIVSPNQLHTISSAINRAYDKGIPVILFDRKTDTGKHTAFMGADNRVMGHTIGQYVSSHLPAKGKILVLKGLKGSSPAQERFTGFMEVMATHKDRIIEADGDWTDDSGRELMKAALQQHPDIVGVCAQNDRMALGAYEMAKEQGLERQMFFTGVDALPNHGGGIELVRDSILLASYIYPTRGDLLMRLAVNILEGKPYEKENLLKSALVTADNAEVMLMQAEEMAEQGDRLYTLHEKVDDYFRQYSHQRIYTILTAIIALLVIGSATWIIIQMHRRHQLEREALTLVVDSVTPIANVEIPKSNDASPERSTVTSLTSEEQAQIASVSTIENSFLEQLRIKVQDHISDSNFSVEELAAEMGLSRVQLYRKAKALTGQTPVDIIRLSRLKRGKALLATGSMNISEVAYAVGFSAPSYFTKCFKDEFGILPGEVEKLKN